MLRLASLWSLVPAKGSGQFFGQQLLPGNQVWACVTLEYMCEIGVLKDTPMLVLSHWGKDKVCFWVTNSPFVFLTWAAYVGSNCGATSGLYPEGGKDGGRHPLPHATFTGGAEDCYPTSPSICATCQTVLRVAVLCPRVFEMTIPQASGLVPLILSLAIDGSGSAVFSLVNLKPCWPGMDLPSANGLTCPSLTLFAGSPWREGFC